MQPPPTPTIIDFLWRLMLDREPDRGAVRIALRDILLMEDDRVRSFLMGAVFHGSLIRRVPAWAVSEMLDAIGDVEGVPLARPSGEIPGATDFRSLLVAGSGKKRASEFNVSSGAVIAAADVGVPIVKLGSRATSSKSGSADFFAALGCPIHLAVPRRAAATVRAVGLGFVNVELAAPRFDHRYGGVAFVPHILSTALGPALSGLRCELLVYGLSFPVLQTSLEVFRERGLGPAVAFTSHVSGMYIDEVVPGARLKVGVLDLEGKTSYATSNLKVRTASRKGEAVANREPIERTIAALQGHSSAEDHEMLVTGAAFLVRKANRKPMSWAAAVRLVESSVYGGGAWRLAQQFVHCFETHAEDSD